MLQTILTTLIGISSVSTIWNGDLKTDPDTELWWHSKYDGTYHYPKCQSEVKATRNETTFLLEELGVYCKEGPFWNFEQKLENMEFQIEGKLLYLNGKESGTIGPKSVRIEFTSEWVEENYILLRNRTDNEGNYHYFNWSVVSDEYITFDLESYNLRAL